MTMLIRQSRLFAATEHDAVDMVYSIYPGILRLSIKQVGYSRGLPLWEYTVVLIGMHNSQGERYHD